MVWTNKLLENVIQVDIYSILPDCVHRVICLQRPVQYSQLLQHVEREYGRNLSMEISVGRGEVSAADLCYRMLVCRIF